MRVTVDQLLKLGCLSQAKVLAGSRGLSNAVSSVTVGEVPDIADWLSGGEIVLSTMFALIDDPVRQQDFCARIMSAGAAALFVKPQRFVGNFPANRCGFTKRAAAPADMMRAQKSCWRTGSSIRANMVERTISPPDSQSAMSGTSPTVTELTALLNPREPASTLAWERQPSLRS